LTAAFFQKNLLFKNKAPIFALKMTYIMNKLIKLLFLSLAIIGLHLSSAARPVDLQTAQSIAIKFMATNNLQLTATYQTDKNAAAFYVFNTTDGFVIVSADDCETPIIGYSREGRFDPDNVPVQMEDYLQYFVARLQYGIENHIEANEVTARQWELVKATGRLNERKNIQAVGPLLTEKWHQGCLYNSLCPEMDGPCDHAEVGCVAVAMGQIMHYWGYPTSGWGSNSYYNQGTQLSADFGNTTYDWVYMPDSLTDASSEEEIEAVATLLYHCGVSVKMEYGNNGSNASSSNVPDAMSRYFDYSRRIHREKKVKYSNEEWLSMLKSSLDSLRPVYYSGQGSAGGHAFVCDGYDDNDLLHFNWGWGGNGDGYFALGNLNPISYSFNNNNYAIFDIIPEYDPCVVTASAYPSTAGTIEGIGEYHIGVQCTLTAVPAENYEFRYWKHDDRIISYEQSYSFEANNDVDYMVAYFVSKPLKEIWAFHAPDTNDINSPYINLSWSYDDNHNWILREEFEINGENLVTTDGEHIYTAFRGYNGNPPFSFGKYTMDGNPVEFFNIDGVRPDGLTCDGNHFYCTKNISSCPIGYLYCYDFTNKTLIDSTYMNMQIVRCAYDADNDGFWFSDILGKSLRLLDRQGQQIHSVNLVTINGNYGFGSITAEDGNPHLLIATNSGMINYDIYDESYTRFGISLQSVFSAGACIGKYDGKDAMFVIANNMYNSNKIRIYEINSHLAPIMHYRLYRARCETETSEADTVMLADGFTDTAFTDTTWSDAPSGTYRFGISEVYFNGVESEIIWSDTIVKTGIGLEENGYGQEVPEQPVQKIIENGQIIIIKDGKRYSVSGQRLK
jgi:hypothetical protein